MFFGLKHPLPRSETSGAKVHFSVGGYSSSSGTWAPADRLPGIRMHLPDARLPKPRPWLEKSRGLDALKPKQNLQNSEEFQNKSTCFPASHVAMGKDMESSQLIHQSRVFTAAG